MILFMVFICMQPTLYFWLYTFDEIKKTKFKKFSFLGDSNYEMSNLWHLSPISLFLFRNYGVILSLFS